MLTKTKLLHLTKLIAGSVLGLVLTMGAANAVVPGTPTLSTPTKGTVTNAVNLSWTAAANAAFYEVWVSENGINAPKTLVGTTTATTFSHSTTAVYSRYYSVIAVSADGTAGASTVAFAAYPNGAPTSTTLSMTLVEQPFSVDIHPSVVDPNAGWGLGETFTYSILSQPAGGSGSVSAGVSYAFGWNFEPGYRGTTSFTYRVTDKGGATIDGTAYITVVAPPAQPLAPYNVTATTNRYDNVTISFYVKDSYPSIIYRDGVAINGGQCIGASPSTNWTAIDATTVAGTSYTYTVVPFATTDYGCTGTPGPASAGVTGMRLAYPPVTNMTASDGLPGKVVVTWTPAATPNFLAHYKLYRDTVALNGCYATTTMNRYDDIPLAMGTTYTYKVRVYSTSSCTGGYAETTDTGYAVTNSAPTATSATISALSTTTSAGVTPSVTDANAGDQFIFDVRVQPTAGQGTASIVNNQLVWTPPAGNGFTGTTTFTYAATDLGGASVIGTATVNVSSPTPAVPTGVSATDGTVGNAVTVSWSAVSGATSYNIASAPSAGGSKTTVATGQTGTSYDYYVGAGTRYYSVQACNGGDCSAWSAEDSGYPLLVVPDVPGSVLASDATVLNTVTVTWTASANAASYKIYSAPYAGATKTEIATGITGTSYSYAIADSAEWKAYSVRAVSSTGGISAYSAEDTGRPMLAVPTNLIASTGLTEGVNVSWTAVPGATSYELRFDAEDSANYLSSSGSTATTSFQCTAVTEFSGCLYGHNYYFTVQARYPDNSIGVESDVVHGGRGPAATLPSAWASLGNYPDKVLVEWQQPASWAAGSGPNNYYLIERQTTGQPATRVDITPFPWNGHLNQTQFADTTAQLGTTYEYFVRLTDDLGNYTAWASAGEGFVSPAIPANLTATEGRSDGVALSWTAVPGATGYCVNMLRDDSVEITLQELVCGVSGPTYLCSDPALCAYGMGFKFAVTALSGTFPGWVRSLPSSEVHGSRAASATLPSASASQGTYVDKVLVEWQSPANWPAGVGPDNWYQIERQLTGQPATRVDITPFPWNGHLNQTQFADTTAQVGVTYDYFVRLVTDAGGYWGMGFTAWADAAQGYLGVAAPTNLTATEGRSDGVALSWTAVPGATGYCVNMLRDDSVEITLRELVCGIPGPTYLCSDPALCAYGMGFKFEVTALSGTFPTWSRSPPSVEVHGSRAPSATLPSASASQGTYADKVLVQWQPPASWPVGVGPDNWYQIERQLTGQPATRADITPFPWNGHLNQTQFADTTAQVGVTYDYFVRLVTDAGGYWGMGFTAWADAGQGYRTQAPGAAPASVAATDGTVTNTVRITWNAVSGATSYTISYAATPGGAKTQITAAGSGTSYDYAIGAVAASRYYSVQACNAGGCSASSAEDAGYANVTPTATSAAISAVATAASAGVTPSVTDPNGTAGQTESYTFAIVAQPSAGQGTASVVGNQLMWTPPATHDFSGTTTFTYRVTDKGSASVAGTATVTVIAIPAVPAGVAATSGDLAGTTISWSAVANATYYQLYSALWTDASHGLAQNNIATLNTLHVGAYGAPYYYKVKACNAAGCSGLSTSVQGNRAFAGTMPAISATDGAFSNKVTVTWAAPPGGTWTAGTGGSPVVYVVERQVQGQSGTRTRLANSISAATYDDASAALGYTYEYFVQAMDNGSNLLAFSPAEAGYAQIAAPAGVSATDGTLTGKVRISWSAPTNAATYKVYSAPSSGGTKTEIATGVTGTSYDYTAADATARYFSVAGVAAAGAVGAVSTEDAGYANQAPTATSASLTAPANASSSGVTPSVTDPNATAGQSEAFTFAVVSQPSAGQGAASVVGNKLVWSPPGDFSFAGNASFSYSVTDSAGASLNGTANVAVLGVAVGVPTSLAATQGTVTDNVALTWARVSGAASYNVYRNGTKVGSTVAAAYDDVAALVAGGSYTVRSVSPSAVESADSSVAMGYPNKAPTTTSASLTATATTASAAVTPTVTDANVAAGQTDPITFAVVAQPAAGEGTASVTANKLVWTPPVAHNFAGPTSFTYSATDNAGASVTGTASVTVAVVAAGVPSNVSATQGTVTDKVVVTWTAVGDAVSYNVYRNGTKLNASAVTATSYDDMAAPVASGNYTVRAVSASGAESAASAPAAGYPNKAPTAVSASLTATAIAASSAVTPTVVDANLTAGQTDPMTFAVVAQPTAGHGTTAVVGNQLVWTPPAAHDFAGTASFTFSATDKAGATVEGTGSVNVAVVAADAPTGVYATQGSMTNTVRVGWDASPSAVSYKVYASSIPGGNKTLVGDNVTGTTYNRTVANPNVAYYVVEGISASGGSSGFSAEAMGWANMAPTSTTASLSATSETASAPVTPSVVDANFSAGQSESYSFTVTDQPPAGEGVASVAANRLMWTPPAALNFAGTTTFGYSATDSAGASVNGTATVQVTGVAADVPSGLTATQGTVNGKVQLAWNAVAGATGYTVYAAATKLTAQPITATGYEHVNASAGPVAYSVHSVSISGTESPASVAAQGWANFAPGSTTATINAQSALVSTPVTPTVVDPNTAAGATDTFTFSIVSQPASGNGTATVVSNALVWTPPADYSFVGTAGFTYKATDKGGLSVNGTATVNVAAAMASPISVTFRPAAGLVPPVGAPYYLTYAGTNIAGTLVIYSKVAGITVKITKPDGSVINAISATTGYAYGVKTENALIGDTLTYKVEAFVTKVPTEATTQTLTFGVIPQRPTLSMAGPTSAATTAPLVYTAKVGVAGVAYDPAKHGRWAVTLNAVSSTGVLTPVEGATADLGADGTVALTANPTVAGRFTYTATALQIDNNTVPARTLRSVNYSVLVQGGEAIPVTVSTKPVAGSGPSPFTGIVVVAPTVLAQSINIGMVTWFVSDDGSNFTPLLDAKNLPVAGLRRLSIAQTLTGNTQKFYKATVANRWSNTTSESPVASLESYLVATVTISVPKVTIVTHPITMTAVPGVAMGSAAMMYQWTVKQGLATVATGEGESFTYTPAATGVLTLTLKAKQADALDVPTAWKTAITTVSVLPPTIPLPSVTGPSLVETGKSYTWSALQRSPFPGNSGTDLVIKSQWVLPDGTTSVENPVTYTMKATDAKTIRYESWFDGYPDSKVGTTLNLSPWGYVWPTWKVLVVANNYYAPTQITYIVQLASSTLAALHNEPISYAFNLPQGATLVSQTGATGILRYDTAGVYAPTVTVSDTRGNSTTVTAAAVTILPPKPLAFTLALTSADRWNRVPGVVYARTTITSVPSSDTVAGTTFFVNGVQLGPETATNAATINLPEAGAYEVKASMRSTKGATAEATQTITMVVGASPVCKLIKGGTGTTTLYFTAGCTVAQGTIVKYAWEVNGQPNTVTAPTLSFTAAQIPGVNEVKVTATTDKGQTGTAIYDMATGAVTRY